MVIGPTVDAHSSTHRRHRRLRILFWVIAVLVTAFAWSGLSLKELFAAISF